MRIHQAKRYTFTATVTDADEQALTPDSGSLTVRDGAGAVVVTVDATVDGTTLTAQVDSLPALDTYTLEWTATVGEDDYALEQHIELAARPYFPLVDLIAWDSTSALDTKTTTRLKQAREEAEDIIERNAHVSFVPRGRRVTVQGDGTSRLLLPDVECRRIVSVTADGVSIAPNTLSLTSWGALDNPAGWTGEVTVHYEHGYTVPPQPIVTAALILATAKATLSGVPSRALSQNTDLGFIRIAVAGRDGYTGIPDVDAAIEQHSRPRMVVG